MTFCISIIILLSILIENVNNSIKILLKFIAMRCVGKVMWIFDQQLQISCLPWNFMFVTKYSTSCLNLPNQKRKELTVR